MSAQLAKLIHRAYKMIGNTTPIPADCGALCDAACCKGDEDTGMLLFPGEAARLANVPGFRVRRISYMDGKAWLLTCRGTCVRRLRPLSCRIFPLAPHVTLDGGVLALPDPRARRMCPLADGAHLDEMFRRRVERALKLLATEPRMLRFIQMLSDEIDELRMFGV